MSRRFPNGETHSNKEYHTAVKAVRSKLGEVKHLSTQRKGKQVALSNDILLVAASEKGVAQTTSIF